MGDNEEKRPKIISLFNRKRSTRSSAAGLQSLQRTAKCAGALGLQCLLTNLSFCQEIYVAKCSIYSKVVYGFMTKHLEHPFNMQSQQTRRHLCCGFSFFSI